MWRCPCSHACCAVSRMHRASHPCRRPQVGPGVLGYGSGGTVVFSGELDGRPVAVKRMLRQFYEVARKEIDALILADEHPNIVRWGPRCRAGAFRCTSHGFCLPCV